MGIHRGPNIIKDGLVFGYDTGYGVADNNNTTRFYPGETTENLIYDMGGTVTSAYPEVVYRSTATETNVIDTSAPGGKYSRFTGIDGNSNNQLYSRFSSYSIDVRGDSVNYSVYLKGSGTCHLTIYDNNSGYGTSPTITLTSDWVRYNYTRTVSASATSYWVAVRGVLNTTDVYVAGQQATRGTHATPYVENNRSSTESLIDLKRTTDIDVSNVSFDSTGQPEFDGTDDYFTTSGLSTNEPVDLTFETVIRFSGSLDSNDRKVFHWDKTSTTNGVAQIRKGTNNGRLMYQHHNGTQWYTLAVDDVVVADTFAHITVVHNGTTATMYKNGVQIGTTSVGYLNYTNAGEILLGYRAGSEYWKGNIPVFKVYEATLSADEVQQNFNAYKNRFNI